MISKWKWSRKENTKYFRTSDFTNGENLFKRRKICSAGDRDTKSQISVQQPVYFSFGQTRRQACLLLTENSTQEKVLFIENFNLLNRLSVLFLNDKLTCPDSLSIFEYLDRFCTGQFCTESIHELKNRQAVC